MTFRIAARVMRIIWAKTTSVSTITGRAMAPSLVPIDASARNPIAVDGNQPSLTPSTNIRRYPIRNSGIEIEASVTPEISLSGQRSRYRTARSPRKIARGTEITAAQNARKSVFFIRAPRAVAIS